ncbi:hypothetical protein Desor_0176 [Desulfosporosinus orientis DSM 765]|uniref:Periplasmic/secreted protein n=1 Tax=Desulfosporosinus orientis (strain ATCC 19365 / DSM 765 / NCIMB 8382 / VKM B-1628 / Singapore I) TaxID=768706 RepID=G7W7H7_DESOD|nr:hypothetical protein [Desulfosporosinus orientis]AET65896.1 hypothetical protein Desor_0176 [Desulfosporosinus orientis DSM 765]
MFKIKDRIMLGAISGVISGTTARILNKINYEIGLTDIRYNPMAAVLFLPKKKIKSLQGTLLGATVNNIGEAVAGIGITYFLSSTGKDYKAFKGMGVGAFSWIMVDGLVGSQKLKIKSSKPFAPTIRLLEHLFAGALCSTLITKLGDESLFPPKTIKPIERIPLVHTGMNYAINPERNES